MKLFNTIIVFDVFCAANSEDEAMATILAAIRNPESPESPSEKVAIAVTHERNVRAAWAEKSPFVGETISEDDYELLKGKKTLEICKMLTEKAPAKK